VAAFSSEAFLLYPYPIAECSFHSTFVVNIGLCCCPSYFKSIYFGS